MRLSSELRLSGTMTAIGNSTKLILASLFEDSSSTDLVIKCGTKEYKVHRLIVTCHSKYFRKCVEGGFQACTLITTQVPSQLTLCRKRNPASFSSRTTSRKLSS